MSSSINIINNKKVLAGAEAQLYEPDSLFLKDRPLYNKKERKLERMKRIE